MIKNTQLAEHVMAVLAGTDSLHPLNIEQIEAKLDGKASRSELETILQDLFNRRVVNTIRSSKDGTTWQQVYWETGLPLEKAFAAIVPIIPQPSRDTNKITENTTTTIEPSTTSNNTNKHIKQGQVTAQVLAALNGLTEKTAKTVNQIMHLCPLSSSRDAIAHILRDLHLKGKLHMRKEIHNGRVQNLYWPVTGDMPTVQDEPNKATESAATNERTRFAIWDDGSVTIIKNQVRIELSRDDVSRLINLINSR